MLHKIVMEFSTLFYDIDIFCNPFFYLNNLPSKCFFFFIASGEPHSVMSIKGNDVIFA